MWPGLALAGAAKTAGERQQMGMGLDRGCAGSSSSMMAAIALGFTLDMLHYLKTMMS